MREPPTHVDEATLLALVRREWDSDMEELEHLPLGFGAHHWVASAQGGPRLFVTFDRLGSKRSLDDLERAYASAAWLAAHGLEFVLACLPARPGRYTVALADGAVSATPWVDGATGNGVFASADEIAACAALLARLHAAGTPAGTPLWSPLVEPTFPDDLAARTTDPWETGPFGAQARHTLDGALGRIRGWTLRYSALAADAVADRDTWVLTHGEPHTLNQIVTSTQRLLVDWESLRLAPKERDLRTFVESGLDWEPAYGAGEPDWRMVEMFDLEWRLSEISEYAAWFLAPHVGNESDAMAIEGLLEELDRHEWQRP